MNKSSALQRQIITRYKYLQQWYATLDVREKKLIWVLALLLGAILLWQLVWQPIGLALVRAQENYIETHDTLQWMQAHVPEVKTPDHATPKDNRPIVTIVTDAAQKFKLTFSHIEPGDNGTLRISLEKASFNNMMLWLNMLHIENAISPSQVSLEKQEEPGIVNVNLTLTSH